jgi:nitrate/TMAO reductase-like tetraheme cytochrome c subunit
METAEKVIVALVVVITLGVVVGVVFVMPVMMKTMTKPESCGKNCHEMQFFYDSLQESVHEDMDCHHCHHAVVPEMLLYMAEAHTHAEWLILGKSYEEMIEEIEDKPPSAPKNEYCVECHEENGVVMSDTITGFTSCAKCHDGTRASAIRHTEHPIGEYSAYESPDYTGHECVACHNDHDIEVTEDTCNICHPPDMHP